MPTLTKRERVEKKYTDRARQTILDPVRFSRVVLGHDMWDMQERMLRSVATHPQTAVKACHSSSKTFGAAELAIWWPIRFQAQGGKVITTAPGMSQVKLSMWGQIRKNLETANMTLPEPDLTQWKLSNDCYAIGLSTNEHMRFAGYKGEKLLVIVDEAPGVRQLIWDAIDGLGAGGDIHVLAIGQPLVLGGTFHDCFHKHRADWHTFTIDAFDTPNLRGIKGPWERQLETLVRWKDKGDPRLYDNERPYLATRDWVVRMWRKWGGLHPYWDSRVRGQFSKQSSKAIVPLAWLEPADTSVAKEATTEVDDVYERTERPYQAGVDPAGEGSNATSMYVRQDSVVVERHRWPDALPTGKVIEVLNRYKGNLKQVNVDVAGIGYGMAQNLENAKFRVGYVNVGEAAHDAERFANLKAELYWGLRDRFEDGDVTGVLGEDCTGQLATIEYDINPRGQIKIESKDELEARGVASPDDAEALMLCFANVPVRGGVTDITIPRLMKNEDV